MAGAGLISQLRSIAASVEVLPEVRDALESMSGNVETMVAEVTRMREGVDVLAVRGRQLNGNVEPLDDRFVEMLGDIEGPRRPPQRGPQCAGAASARVRRHRQARRPPARQPPTGRIAGAAHPPP